MQVYCIQCTKGFWYKAYRTYPLDLTHTKNMSLFPNEKEINKPYLKRAEAKDIFESYRANIYLEQLQKA